jgi:signal transduction histidine kinase
MQLVMNAIKYARGSTYATVSVMDRGNECGVSVTDVGKTLDDEEKVYMWDFGWRGKKAKELHVNGSGIGLYTVKKIVTAHGGTVGYRVGGVGGGIVTFLFWIPKGDVRRGSV